MKLLATFDDFVKLANYFYITIGIEPYRRQDVSKTQAFCTTLIFYSSFINMHVILLGEILYVVMAAMKRENFLEATMTMSYIGFVVVGSSKMIFIYKQKDDLTKFVNGLQQIFPKTVALQQDYNIKYYLNLCSRITMSFSILYMILIWTYNLFGIIQYFIYDVCLNIHQVNQTLPYFMFTPWNWHNHWSYYLLYTLQDIAGYTSATGQIASDLLLIACATQLIMHYDFISQKLGSYKVKGVAQPGFIQDMTFIADIIQYHTKLLHLTDQLNEVFGIPLLLNFAASSFVICFVGFQATIGATPETIFKLLLFLFSSIAQVYLICYYGQQLMDASTQVAQSAYNQNWPEADVRYIKMLILIAQRSQKPALLKATSFVLISRATMTQIMQISYKFFALLRTMYGE